MPAATTALPIPAPAESGIAIHPRRDKLKKFKGRSNRYKIPDHEYDQLTELKKYLAAMGVSVKRSELVRAGLVLLMALYDVQLKPPLAKADVIKAGPPPKKARQLQ